MYYLPLCVSARDYEDGVARLRDQLYCINILYFVTNRPDNLVTNPFSVHRGDDDDRWLSLVVIDRHSYTLTHLYHGYIP